MTSRRHGVDRRPLRDPFDFLDERRDVVNQVRLVEDDHRRRPAVPRGQEIPFDAARIEIVVETRNEQHDVDVRGDDLFFGWIAGRAAREPAESRQHGTDARVAAVRRGLDRHPIADRRVIRATFTKPESTAQRRDDG